MNGFYVSFIFLGILLIIVSLICIFLDKKKVFDFTKNFDDKKQELTEIISDAELMIDELNNYSDYIVNQMDLKNEELTRNLMDATKRVDKLTQKAQSIYVDSDISDNTVNASVIDETIDDIIEDTVVQSAADAVATASLSEPKIRAVENSSTFAVAVNSADTVTAAYTRATNMDIHSNPTVKKEKVIPLRKKYAQVLSFSKGGMKSLDIARELNMGKGEVELIIGLKK